MFALSAEPFVINGLFVVGSAAFYLLMVALVCFLFFCMDRDWGIGATGALLLAAFALWFAGDFNVFAWTYKHKLTALLYVGIYIGTGVIWSFVKWLIWGRERAAKINELKADWIESNPRPTFDMMQVPNPELFKIDRRTGEVEKDKDGQPVRLMTTEQEEAKRYDMLNAALEYYQKKWMDLADSAGYVETTKKGVRTTIPQFARNHKRRVTMWASYWPFSFIWTFCDDVVTKFFKEVITYLSGHYQAVMNKVHQGTDVA